MCEDYNKPLYRSLFNNRYNGKYEFVFAAQVVVAKAVRCSHTEALNHLQRLDADEVGSWKQKKTEACGKRFKSFEKLLFVCLNSKVCPGHENLQTLGIASNGQREDREEGTPAEQRHIDRLWCPLWPHGQRRCYLPLFLLVSTSKRSGNWMGL